MKRECSVFLNWYKIRNIDKPWHTKIVTSRMVYNIGEIVNYMWESWEIIGVTH